MKQTRHTSGFTLIELLVVIAIIALLAGLLFPAIGSAMKTAKRAKATAIAQSIESAILIYSNDNNGRLPMPDAGHGNTDNPVPTGTSPNFTYSENILSILMALDRAWNTGDVKNPTQKVYLDTEIASSDGKLLDPWGTQYYIILDRDFNGKIDYMNTSGGSHRKKVVVVSAGPDRDFGSGTSTDSASKDNIANVELNN